MGTFFDNIASPQGKPHEFPLEVGREEAVAAASSKLSQRKQTAPRMRMPKVKKEPEEIIQQNTMPKETHLKVGTDGSNPEASAEEREEDGELTVDIYDAGEAIMIQSTVAGVKPEDLDISITADSVTVRGKRKQMDEVRDEDYYYKELFWGAFSRSIILPEEIEEGEAEATLKHGLLSIRLPKKKRNTVQKLKVKVT